MTFVTAPDIIEQSGFVPGWNPDQSIVTSDPASLRDMYNLLPELGGTGALVTRKGFKRLREELGGGLSGHYVKNLYQYHRAGENYTIAVLTNGANAVDNVRLYAVKLSDGSVARIDTTGVNWDNPTSPHWGITIDNVYYGGSKGNTMYSWDGTTWDADASTNPNWKTVVDAINDSVTTATQYARNYAFKGKEIVIYGTDHYMPAQDIRFDTWDDNAESKYRRGNKVSRKATWASTASYWKSFECLKTHVPDDVAAADPGTGASWRDYWKIIRLPLPVTADGDTSSKWYFVPLAAETPVACWHGDRLWMRMDGHGDKSRAQYSAPVKPDKGMDIADVSWDPTDFAPGNDIRGPGGGWLPFNDGKKGGIIEAMRSYGQYLIVFKRQAIWVVSGKSDETFNVRRLATGVGAVGPNATVELDGLVYFLSDDGLYVTDGTAVEPVGGFEKFANTLEARIDAMVATSDDIEPQIEAYDDRIWISLPNADAGAGEKYWTVVYEPRTSSAWKTNLPVIALNAIRHNGVPRLYFGAPLAYSGVGGDLVYEYDHVSAADADDSGAGTYAAGAIAWFLTTAWWPFGFLREERRVRRTWGLVKGVLTYTMVLYEDYTATVQATVARTVTASTPSYIEGAWIPDAHSLSMKLSSTAAPATVYALAVHTEPRRHRYHTG